MTKKERRVLIIDDSPQDRETYRRYLLQDPDYTYVVLESESGEEGLELCKLSKPDSVILDYLLPDIDGLEFLEELRDKAGKVNIPIVMMTGYGNEAVAVQAMKSGAQDYLAKGQLTSESLRHALHNAIEKAELLRQLEKSEERFRTSVETMLDCFGIYTSVRDASGRIVDFHTEYLNEAACINQQIIREEPLVRGVCDLMPVLPEIGLFDEYCQVVETGQPVLKEWLIYEDGGNKQKLIRAIDIRLTKLGDGFAAAWRDITDRKRAESALLQANEKLAGWVNDLEQRNREITLLAEMSDVLQACLTVEEAYTAIATLMPPLFPQASGGIFLTNASKNLVEVVTTWGSPPLSSEEIFTPHECWALRRSRVHWVEDTDNGLLCKHLHHTLPAESLCVPMMAQGEAMGVLYLSSLLKGQLTETKQHLAVRVADHIALSLANLKLRERLRNQSIRDPLTGLFNRRYMEESLERELHRCNRKQQSLGIIMLDVDHFKRFNDTFGHEAGDAVLRELGHILQKYIRKSDIACRYGGEELTLILPETSLEVVRLRAEQIREGVKQLRVQHRHQSLGAITLSLGVACFPEHGLTGEEVLRAADAALYRAKAEGRDTVRIAL